VGILIDTSVLIAQERSQLSIAEQVRATGNEGAYISVISASELLHGIWRTTDPAIRARRTVFAEGIVSDFPLIQIDLAIARIHAQIWAEQKASGRIVGPHDLWLAATCFAHGLRIATRNVREFGYIPGLQIERW